MSKMIRLVLDSDSNSEYMYPKIGESDADYETRMAVARVKRRARMTNEAKQQADRLNRLYEDSKKRLAEQGS